VFDGTRLGIGGAGNTEGMLTVGTGTVTDKNGIVLLRGAASSVSATQVAIFNEINGIGSAESLTFRSPGGYKFQNNDGTSELARLTSTGLGIGTTSPLSKLSVAQGADGFDQGITLSRAGADRGTIFLNASNNTLNFGRSTATYLSLDSSGNLGLGGITPNAWTNSASVIQGYGWSISTNGTNSNSVDFTSNAYRSGGTTSFRYEGSSTATNYKQSIGEHQWFTAPSGTAGNAITFTQAMTLDASGNLLVGTTSTTNTSGGLILRQNGNGVDLNASGSTGAIGIRGTASTGAALIDFYPVSLNPASAPFYSGRIFYSFVSDFMSFATGGSERARINSSGNLLVGTTSGVARLAVTNNDTNPIMSGVNQATFTGGANFDVNGFRISSGGDVAGNTTRLCIAVGNGSQVYLDAENVGGVNSGSNLLIYTRANGGGMGERARIDSSGNLLVGTTTYAGGANVAGFGANPVGQIAVERDGGSTAVFNRFSSDGQLVLFRRQGTTVGDISVSTLVTTYNTTSDYRLKTVIGAVADSGSRIDALQPVEYTWNSNGSRTRGFLAHQFQEVYAGSVSGTKDAVDSEGKPVYQAMQASTSEVIADLVAEIQSLRIRITQLENKL
jgi:hypothetical protein